MSCLTESAMTAGDGGVERDALTDTEVFHVGTDVCDDSGRFVSHDEGRDATSGGAVIPVNVGTADAAGFDADEDVIWTDDRVIDVGAGDFFIFGEEEGFHEF